MIRPPPTPPPFPSPPLSRPPAGGNAPPAGLRLTPMADRAPLVGRRTERKRLEDALERGSRSEEHTSELQLHVNLVCRLLLEKKKNINTKHKIRDHENDAADS